MSNERRTAVPKTYKLFIGGQFPRTESGRYFAFGDTRVNVCLASRKDARNAVVAARKAFAGWAAASSYLKGQILYRIAEM
ncbi:MAG: aldehyde dehydrogenase, partial [Pseudomonadota bacterium]